LASLLRLLDRLPLRKRVIYTDEGGPYLLRVYLTPDRDWWRNWLPGVFLHRFFRSDSDRELHNHPWRWALSIILSGGYREERMERDRIGVTSRILIPSEVNFITDRTFHRVDLLDPVNGAWTLFIVGPRFRDWGFLSRNGRDFEHWRARDRRIAAEKANAEKDAAAQ